MYYDDREALRRLVEEQGDEDAAARLAEMAVHDDDDEMRRFLVDSGRETAAARLAAAAAENGDLASLRLLVDADITSRHGHARARPGGRHRPAGRAHGGHPWDWSLPDRGSCAARAGGSC
jgi:hypothetical protein